MNNIQLVSLWEQATFNEIIWCQVCTKQTRLVVLYGVNSLKQQYVGNHISPLGHNILIPSQNIFALTP